MSADFNDVIREGYVKMKSKHFNTWSKRWLILKTASSKGPKRLEKFHHEKQSLIQGTDCKVIPLEEVKSVARIPSDQKKHGISLELQDGTSRQFICNNDTTALEWYRDLNELTRKRDSISSSRSESVIDELFNVYLLPSPNLNIYGECILQVSKEHINLYDVYDTKKKLISWPITALRRYGKDESKFTLEAGRMCSTGEGIFSFNTPKADRIHSKVHSASNAIVAAYSIQRKQSAPDRVPLERSQSESPVSSPVALHSPVHQSKSFPTPSMRPPAPLPRESPSNSLQRPGQDNVGDQSNSDVLPAGREHDCEASSYAPPLPPGRNKTGAAAGAQAKTPLRRPTVDTLNGENNNNDADYVYEEKYLEPVFREYLAERKA